MDQFLESSSSRRFYGDNARDIGRKYLLDGNFDEAYQYFQLSQQIHRVNDIDEVLQKLSTRVSAEVRSLNVEQHRLRLQNIQRHRDMKEDLKRQRQLFEENRKKRELEEETRKRNRQQELDRQREREEQQRQREHEQREAERKLKDEQAKLKREEQEEKRRHAQQEKARSKAKNKSGRNYTQEEQHSFHTPLFDSSDTSSSSSSSSKEHPKAQSYVSADGSKLLTAKFDDDEAVCKYILGHNCYYALFGFPFQANIDEEALKVSYRFLALKAHPDKNKSTDSNEAFKKLGHAYDVLKKPSSRQLYDLSRTSPPPSSSSSSSSSSYSSSFFFNAAPPPPTGFSCAYCNKLFNNQKSAKSHVANCKMAPKVPERFLCAYCQQEFKSQRACQEHANSCLWRDCRGLCELISVAPIVFVVALLIAVFISLPFGLAVLILSVTAYLFRQALSIPKDEWYQPRGDD